MDPNQTCAPIFEALFNGVAQARQQTAPPAPKRKRVDSREVKSEPLGPTALTGIAARVIS